MKYVWALILLFLMLILTGCRSKMVGSTESSSEIREEIKYNKFLSLSDTIKTLRVSIDKSKLKITERIVVTEYDSMGVISKRTETDRNITHDADKTDSIVDEQGEKAVLVDSLNHIIDANEKVTDDLIKESGKSVKFPWWMLAIIGVIIYLCMREK